MSLPELTARYTSIDEAGRARPWLVMVHGASQHSGLFSAQVAAFRRDYRLLLIDLPGHGGSSSVPGPYGLVEYAGSVRAALDAAEVKAAHYWGTHTGAGVGLVLASEDPRRFRSLVLEAPTLPDEPMPYVAATIERARTAAAASGVAAAIDEWYREAAWFDVIRQNPVPCRADAQRALLAAFTGAPWIDHRPPAPAPRILPRLRDLSVPTLLLNGEHDVADFMRVADILAVRLPNCSRRTIPRAGGFPLWEFPDEVNAEVSRFLDGLAGAVPAR